MMEIMINEINNEDTVKMSLFLETCNLKQIIQIICKIGYKATYGEMMQLNQITCFKPIKVTDSDPGEKKEHWNR